MDGPLQKFTSLANELGNKIVGKHIVDMRQLRSHDFLFILSETKDYGLAVSLDPVSPLVCPLDLTFEWQQLPRVSSPALKTHLAKAKIDGVAAAADDFVLTLTLHRKTDLFQIENSEFVIEMFRKHPNLLLTVANRIVYVHKPFGLEQTRPLLPGLAYKKPKSEDTVHNRSFDEDIIRYQTTIWAKAIEEKARPLLKSLHKRQAQLEKKLANLDNDLAVWQKSIALREIADILIGHPRRDEHAKNIDIDGDVFDLDPALTIAANAKKMYSRYRKGKQALVPINEQRQNANAELDEINRLTALPLPRSMYELEDLTSALAALNLWHDEKPSKAIETQKSLPYFVIIDEIKYSFGRQAIQNDYLTFKIARLGDWFFHVHNYPGAHVICHHDNPTAHMMETAANLALLLSHRSEGEVAYARVKTLKKGPKPGAVFMREQQLILIKETDDALTSFLANAKRYQR